MVSTSIPPFSHLVISQKVEPGHCPVPFWIADSHPFLIAFSLHVVPSYSCEKLFLLHPSHRHPYNIALLRPKDPSPPP
jgi:hypothetical protein